MQRRPSNPYLKWHISLHEIEAQIIQFTNLPTQTPNLHLLAQDITIKFGFIRNFLIHESASYNSIPDDLLQIEQKLLELEAEFYHSNLHRVDVQHEQEQEQEQEHEHEPEREHEDSVMGSVCESCLNYDRELGSDEDAWGVHDGIELLHDYEVMVPKKVEETTSCDCKREKRRRRWWWRTVVTLMPASVVIMVVTYIDKKQREGFLVPT